MYCSEAFVSGAPTADSDDGPVLWDGAEEEDGSVSQDGTLPAAEREGCCKVWPYLSVPFDQGCRRRVFPSYHIPTCITSCPPPT